MERTVEEKRVLKDNAKQVRALGAPQWYECHWSLAASLEAAHTWFASKGISGGTIYAVPFGWWLVL